MLKNDVFFVKKNIFFFRFDNSIFVSSKNIILLKSNEQAKSGVIFEQPTNGSKEQNRFFGLSGLLKFLY